LGGFRVEHKGPRFLLYYGIAHFFQNGGGPCYVVSVGDYGSAGIEASKLRAGIDLLLEEQEPTLLVIPDAVQVTDADACAEVQAQALSHCFETKRRFAILDVFNGDQEQTGPGECVKTFREKLPTEHLDYAAAYYPWLNTSAVDETDLSYKNVDPDGLAALLKAENTADSKLIGQVKNRTAEFSDDELQKALIARSPVFVRVMREVRRQVNVLPPSAAVAGVYATVDRARGVWKAPANVALNSVISPTVSISSEEQAPLNVDPAGKSINAIRVFPGAGVLVWGARTLDGNSPEWRYVNVRRTTIFLEQSIERALRPFVFAENTSATWATVESLIFNFLNDIWRNGGLQGASPKDAYGVACGLGETMTQNDMLEGILRVRVSVALIRPAEFTVIALEQRMQTT
jgi:phage tail sheath protein FI